MSSTAQVNRVKQWNYQEIEHLVRVYTRMEKIQTRVNDIVRGLIQFSGIIDLCPALLQYKSTFRKIDPKEEFPPAQMVQTVETHLKEMKEGVATIDSFKKMGEIFRQLNQEDRVPTLQAQLAKVQCVSKWLEFARDPQNRSVLTTPEHHQALYRLDALPHEVSDEIFEESMGRMEALHKKLIAVTMGFGQELERYQPFLSPVDKLIYKASTYFTPLKAPMMDPELSALMETKFKAVMSSYFQNQERFVKKIQDTINRERIAETYLAADQSQNAYAASCVLLNDPVFKKLSPEVRFAVLRTLAESDPVHGPFFERMMWDLETSLYKSEPSAPCNVQ